MGSTALRVKKTYTDKTKLNPAARDDTLRSKDTKRSVCARNWTVFISFFTSDPPHSPTVLRVWRVFFFFFLLYGGSQTYKWITATYLSNGPLTLLIEIVVVSRSQTFRLTAERLGTLAALNGQGPPKRPYDWQEKQPITFHFVPGHVQGRVITTITDRCVKLSDIL